MTKTDVIPGVDVEKKKAYSTLVKKVEGVSSLDEFLEVISSNGLELNPFQREDDNGFTIVKKLNDDYLLLKKSTTTFKPGNDSIHHIRSYKRSFFETVNVYHEDPDTLFHWTTYLLSKIDGTGLNFKTAIYTGDYMKETLEFEENRVSFG